MLDKSSPRGINTCISAYAACIAVVSGVPDGRGEVRPAASLPPVRAAAAATTVQVPQAAFTARELKTSVEPGVAVAELSYDFRNTGDFPLAVEEFVQSCGCMLGEWDGKPVEPGATGKIRTKFLTKGLRGKVRKSLHVKFHDMGTVELVAEVVIPEAVTYSAQTLRWEIGTAPQPREVDITVHAKAPLRVLSVTGSDPAFTSTLETLEDGRHYRVTLTPRDTDSERICVFQVRTDAKDPRDALQGLFALVEKPTAKPDSPRKGGTP